MKCWICQRQAKGYGHTDNQHGVGSPRRYPIDWVFCSMRCQDAFHAMYGNWQRVRNGDIDIKGVAMIDPSEMESAAMKQCLKCFGEAAGEIGFTKPLGEYSEAQALQVIEATRFALTCITPTGPRSTDRLGPMWPVKIMVDFTSVARGCCNCRTNYAPEKIAR